MSNLRIALAQCAFRVGDVAGNARLIADGIVHARDALGADLVLFPELSLCGYPPEDLLLRPSFRAACDAALAELASHTQGIVAVRSEEHTSELQSLMRISYAVFCLKKKKHNNSLATKVTTA